MKRPPLQVPTATCPGSRTGRSGQSRSPGCVRSEVVADRPSAGPARPAGRPRSAELPARRVGLDQSSRGTSVSGPASARSTIAPMSVDLAGRPPAPARARGSDSAKRRKASVRVGGRARAGVPSGVGDHQARAPAAPARPSAASPNSSSGVDLERPAGDDLPHARAQPARLGRRRCAQPSPRRRSRVVRRSRVSVELARVLARQLVGAPQAAAEQRQGIAARAARFRARAAAPTSRRPCGGPARSATARRTPRRPCRRTGGRGPRRCRRCPCGPTARRRRRPRGSAPR